MYSEVEQNFLLKLAHDSIESGLSKQPLALASIDDIPASLQEKRACFVTLEINHQLRGCVGSLVAVNPLYLDVIHNAQSAAFKDHRFSPLTIQEFPNITIHISILTPPEKMPIKSEQDLLSQLQPGIDGLIIQSGNHRATFLPEVWKSLTTPFEFLRQLKHKAGMAPDYWAADFQAWRYRAEVIPTNFNRKR